MNKRKPAAFLTFPTMPFLRATTTTLTRRCFQSSIPVAAAINGSDGLPNARDLSSACPSLVQPDKIYRGASPATLPKNNPNQDAVDFLRSTACLIDLRSNDERRSDERSSMEWACGSDFTEKENHIGLLNKRRVVWGLARVLPPSQLRQLTYHIISNPLSARTGVTNRIDKGGLILLNRILVAAGSASIGRALNTVTDGVQKGKVYFYCSAGKDRTGLLAALILKTLGVDDSDVIFDYVRSSETWENGPFHIRSEYSGRLEQAGLTPLNWIGSPPDVMQETLRYIRKQYGSIEDYMIHCGFEENRMNELREAMSYSAKPVSNS